MNNQLTRRNFLTVMGGGVVGAILPSVPWLQEHGIQTGIMSVVDFQRAEVHVGSANYISLIAAQIRKQHRYDRSIGCTHAGYCTEGLSGPHLNNATKRAHLAETGIKILRNLGRKQVQVHFWNGPLISHLAGQYWDVRFIHHWHLPKPTMVIAT